MTLSASLLSFDNPVFQVYALTASLMLLKLTLQPWMTIARMLRVRGGYRSPEDARKSPTNPDPDPAQLGFNDYVDRSRRLNLNDLESIPGFLAAGLLFVLTEPPLLLAQWLFGIYLLSRILHFAAYLSAQLHEVRALCWAPSSLSLLAMAGYVLLTALQVF